MKFSLLFLNLLLWNAAITAQNPLTKKTFQRYDGDTAIWKTENIETWNYDEQQREVASTWWNHYQGAFQPHNNRKIETQYTNFGQLNLIENRAWGDTLFSNIIADYKYNEEQQLTEIIHEHNSSSGETYFNRVVFEKNAAENKHTMKDYSAYGTADNWILNHQRDTFADVNGCLEKQTILNFDPLTQEMSNQRWWTYSYNDNCQLNSSEYWLWDREADSMFIKSRHLYSYENEGKTTFERYETWNNNLQDWQLKNKQEKVVNDEGKRTKWLYENYVGDRIDTVLQLTTYALENEIATHKEYKANQHYSLRLTRLDSFVYERNDRNLLIKKDQFTRQYNDPIWQTTTKYQYYCNDSLRMEFFETLPQTSRILYEYHGEADCNLQEENPEIKVFPNPTENQITIESNLLATENSAIQLYTVAGQLVFSQPFDFIAFRTQLQLPALPTGSYILVIQNDETRVSKQIVIY